MTTRTTRTSNEPTMRGRYDGGETETPGRKVHVVAAVTVLAMAIATMTGCGVRPDRSARTLAANQVPYGLLDKVPAAAASPTATTLPPVARVNVAVYFLAGDRLQAAPRSVPEPATPLRAVIALLDGPTDDEGASGLRTAINPATEVSVTRPQPEIVAVDLNVAFAAVPTQEQRLALAQIVFTATGIGGVTGVRFTLAGAPVEVPLPDGTLTSAPVGRNAFANVAPPATPFNQPA